MITAPCEVCGQPTTAKSGICRSTSECKNEYARRKRRANIPDSSPQTCYVCGHPITRWNKTGLCEGRTPACLTERSRLWRAGMTAEQSERKRVKQQAAFAQLSTERRRQRSTQARARYIENPALGMLTAAKRNRRRGIPVTITAADIWVPVNCPACGVLMTTGQVRSSDKSPSLDRYDPPLGYVPGNIMVICRGCNRRKQNQTGEQMREFAKAIIKAKAMYDRRQPARRQPARRPARGLEAERPAVPLWRQYCDEMQRGA